MENTGIEYIASYARSRGFSVTMINAGLHGLSPDDIIQIIRLSRYRILGISVLHWTIKSSIQIAQASRRFHPDRYIILGGIEAALNAEYLLANFLFVDSICLGEGEKTVAELLSCFSGSRDWRSIKGLAYRVGESVVFNSPADLINPLDALPFPARDDIASVFDLGGPITVSTSRGCFGNCHFCPVRSFYRLSKGASWRGRSPMSVAKEIKFLHETYGADLFSFIDETVAGPGDKGMERLRELAAGIRDSHLNIDFFLTIRADQITKDGFRELKAVGLKKVEIGIESMAESQLHRYGKTAQVKDNHRALAILDALGIQSEIFMIPYDPEVTYSEIKKNFTFYRKRFSGKKARYDVSPLTMADYLYPYPGTRSRQLYESLGLLGHDYFVPFHALRPAVTKTQRVVGLFLAAIHQVFPMSYAGLGNLWINSARLPKRVYHEICLTSARFGKLLSDLTFWVYGITSSSRPLTAQRKRQISNRLGKFLALASKRHDQTRRIMRRYGSTEQKHPSPKLFPNHFSRQLYLYGRCKKRDFIKNSYKKTLEGDRLLPVLMSLLENEK